MRTMTRSQVEVSAPLGPPVLQAAPTSLTIPAGGTVPLLVNAYIPNSDQGLHGRYPLTNSGYRPKSGSLYDRTSHTRDGSPGNSGWDCGGDALDRYGYKICSAVGKNRANTGERNRRLSQSCPPIRGFYCLGGTPPMLPSFTTSPPNWPSQ